MWNQAASRGCIFQTGKLIPHLASLRNPDQLRSAKCYRRRQRWGVYGVLCSRG